MAEIDKTLSLSYADSTMKLKIPLKSQERDENNISTGITEIEQSEADEVEQSDDSFGSFEEAEQVEDFVSYVTEKSLEVDDFMRPKQPLSMVITKQSAHFATEAEIERLGKGILQNAYIKPKILTDFKHCERKSLKKCIQKDKPNGIYNKEINYKQQYEDFVQDPGHTEKWEIPQEDESICTVVASRKFGVSKLVFPKLPRRPSRMVDLRDLGLSLTAACENFCHEQWPNLALRQVVHKKNGIKRTPERRSHSPNPRIIESKGLYSEKNEEVINLDIKGLKSSFVDMIPDTDNGHEYSYTWTNAEWLSTQ